MELVASSLS